jgi:hypothetical protein
MKIMSIVAGSSLARIFTTAVLFTFGLETRLPAPPATPVPTYYGETFDFGTGATLGLETVDSGNDYEIDDWDIPTPDGTLTPADSQIVSGGGPFTITSFFDVFTEITLTPDPIQFEGTTPSTLSSYWDVEMGPVGGSITDPDGGVSEGYWSIPDHTPTWLLLLAGAGVLCLGKKSRKFQTGV